MSVRCLALIVSLIFWAGTSVYAQDSTQVKGKKKGTPSHFVDKNGDGYNDNAPDHDGDGIPNCLDPDWLKLNKKERPAFRDLDGDGINDFLQHRGRGKHGYPGGRVPRIRPHNPGEQQGPRQQKMKGRK